jgi:hypothetical protein
MSTLGSVTVIRNRRATMLRRVLGKARMWLLRRRLQVGFQGDLSAPPGWNEWLTGSRDVNALWADATEPSWLVHLAFDLDIPQSRLLEAAFDAVELYLHYAGDARPIVHIEDRGSHALFCRVLSESFAAFSLISPVDLRAQMTDTFRRLGA